MKIKQKLHSGLHVLLWKEGKWFVAKCVEVEVASQGNSRKKALKNIEEALELYFEEEKVSLPKSLSMLELHNLSVNIPHA